METAPPRERPRTMTLERSTPPLFAGRSTMRGSSRDAPSGICDPMVTEVVVYDCWYVKVDKSVDDVKDERYLARYAATPFAEVVTDAVDVLPVDFP